MPLTNYMILKAIFFSGHMSFYDIENVMFDFENRM